MLSNQSVEENFQLCLKLLLITQMNRNIMITITEQHLGHSN